MKPEIVSAFVKNLKGGNPAGVMLNADALSNSEKQKIAKGLGLSETAFVSKAEDADYLLEFFTPNKQIPHCGHATIATFGYMQSKGMLHKEVYRMNTIDGSNQVIVKGEMIFMEQKKPTYTSVIDESSVFASLRISPSSAGRPLVVNTGNSFLLLEISNVSDLRQIKYRSNLVEAISEEYDLIGYYLYSREVKNADAITRMFGPRYGIYEESATGMAAGPLACYLHDFGKIEKEKFIIEQGTLMPIPSPSELMIELKVENNEIQSLIVGGRAAVIS